MKSAGDIRSENSDGELDRHQYSQDRVLLVVVTYNSEDHVQRLSSIVSAWASFGYAVIIDNSASNEMATRMSTLQETHPRRFMFVSSQKNSGFSPGVNNAVSAAESLWGRFDAIVLLNPDVNVEPSVIFSLAMSAMKRPEVGVAGAALVDDYGNQDNGSARRRWNLRRLFCDVAGVRFLQRALLTRPRAIDIDSGEPDMKVDMVSGALMCIKRDLFGQGLDLRLPMYLEDQEICLRALRQGFEVVCYTTLRATHTGGESRQSATAHTRALRCLELAEAPAIIMSDWSGYRTWQVKVAIAVGAAVRGLLAITILLRGLINRNRDDRKRSLDNLVLSKWLVRWCVYAKPIRGRRGISLDEYFSIDRRAGI